MNKYMTLIVLVLFLILVTLVADSALGISTSGIIDQFDTPPPETWLGRFSAVTNMISAFFKIMTFQVPGLPVFINLIVFYPITFAIAYMIIDIIRG